MASTLLYYQAIADCCFNLSILFGIILCLIPIRQVSLHLTKEKFKNFKLSDDIYLYVFFYFHMTFWWCFLVCVSYITKNKNKSSEKMLRKDGTIISENGPPNLKNLKMLILVADQYRFFFFVVCSLQTVPTVTNVVCLYAFLSMIILLWTA